MAKGPLLKRVGWKLRNIASPVTEPIGRSARRIAESHLGWDNRNWLRVRQIEAFTDFLTSEGRNSASVLEVSPGWNTRWKELCDDYTAVDYPDFDICDQALDQHFQTVIADQVFEHVQRPVAAMSNVYSMVAPGGWAMIATPFMFRVHARPHDFSRWTKEGLRQLLIEGGFAKENIATFAWGNKACVRAHIGGRRVLDYGWRRDLSNDEEYPIMVWAFAQKQN